MHVCLWRVFAGRDQPAPGFAGGRVLRFDWVLVSDLELELIGALEAVSEYKCRTRVTCKSRGLAPPTVILEHVSMRVGSSIALGHLRNLASLNAVDISTNLKIVCNCLVSSKNDDAGHTRLGLGV